MQCNTFVASLRDIKACSESPYISEVLIEPELFAREGRLSIEEVNARIAEAHTHHLRAVLVWDILMTDEDFTACALALKTIDLTHVAAIRVQCLGAARHIYEHYPHVKIQLIAETAHCNLITLQHWCSYLKERLERIVLSIQLPAEKIAHYGETLPVPCEVLGIGRILLFYSRRNLLKKNFGDLGESWREVIAASEESHDRPFPIVDNTHGTFMYLDKDQFIVHKLHELGSYRPAFLRIDLRHLSEFPDSSHDIVRIASEARTSPESLRESWPRPTIAPFFKSNLTTKQFKFLNSELRFSRDESCIAEVVSTEREKHTVLRIVQPFSMPQRYLAIDPNGSEVLGEFHQLKSLSGDALTEVSSDQLVLAPWMRKITTGSLVLRAV
jgi:putative protease